MSSAAIVTSAPANIKPARRGRQSAENRLIEQQSRGESIEDEDEDISVTVAPTTPVNTRRRARRSSWRNSARDDLKEYLNCTADNKNGPFFAHEDELDLDVALVLSLSLADSRTFSEFGISEATITDMTYESLVQLKEVRCVASTAFVSALPVCCNVKEHFSQAADVCVICQVEYKEGEVQMNLPCLHKFHQACGAEWLSNFSKLCPVCKHDVRVISTFIRVVNYLAQS